MKKLIKVVCVVVGVGNGYAKVEIVNEQGQTLEYEVDKDFGDELEDALYRMGKDMSK